MKYRFVLIFLFLLKFVNAQTQSDFFRHGFRLSIFTNDFVNKNYKDPYFTLNSNSSLCYELGYLIRTNNKFFIESGINTGLNTIVYTVKFNDFSNEFDYWNKIRNYDIFYTKFPIFLGYNEKIFNKSFQFKAGINLAFIKPGSIKTGIYNTNVSGVSTHYFSNQFDINFKENMYKSASLSVGNYINIFKKNTLLMELNLTYFPDDIGDYYFEAYPNDPRNILLKGKLEDNWNFGINITYLL